MEVNHSDIFISTYTQQTAQHDAIVFACGRFSALDCFMIISLFSLSLSHSFRLWWSKSFCVISSILHDNLFLITSDQSWHFLLCAMADIELKLNRKHSHESSHHLVVRNVLKWNEEKEMEMFFVLINVLTCFIQCQTSSNEESAKFRMTAAWIVVKLFLILTSSSHILQKGTPWECVRCFIVFNFRLFPSFPHHRLRRRLHL